MKKIISVALIILLSIQCFYTLGVISYFQLNREYIVEVLCINKEKPLSTCHGQCFLKRNLNVSDDTESVPTSDNQNKIELPIFLITPVYTITVDLLEVYSSHCLYATCYAFDYTATAFRPPRLS